MILLNIMGIHLCYGQDYQIKWLDIDPKSDIFSPQMHKGLMVYCHINKRQNKSPYSQAKMCYFNQSVDFAPEILSDKNEGPMSFAKNDSLMAITKNLNERTDIVRVGIFTYEWLDGKWANETAFPFNNASFSVAHPSLSADGKELYFSSDMPGGHGGFDIYLSRFQDGKWSKPINLGKGVNSEGNELFPFLSDDNKLYFASDARPPNVGGLDIYYSELFDYNWIDAVALPFPINSSANDYGIYFSSERNMGYFSSSRKKYDQIFFMRIAFPEIAYDSICISNNCPTFFENGFERGKNLENFDFVWSASDGSSYKGNEWKKCFDSTGSYRVNLKVYDKVLHSFLADSVSYTYETKGSNNPNIQAKWGDTSKTRIQINVLHPQFDDFEPVHAVWMFGSNLKTGFVVDLPGRSIPEYFKLALYDEMGRVKLFKLTEENIQW